MTGFRSYPYTQESQDLLDSTNSDPNFMNTIITGDDFWVYGYMPGIHHFSYNGNPMRALNTMSLCWSPSTDAIERWEKNSCIHMKVQGPLMKAHFIEIHQIFTKQNKVGYFSNRVVFLYQLTCVIDICWMKWISIKIFMNLLIDSWLIQLLILFWLTYYDIKQKKRNKKGNSYQKNEEVSW